MTPTDVARLHGSCRARGVTRRRAARRGLARLARRLERALLPPGRHRVARGVPRSCSGSRSPSRCSASSPTGGSTTCSSRRAFHFKYWGFAWVAPLSRGRCTRSSGCSSASRSRSPPGSRSASRRRSSRSASRTSSCIDVSTYLNHYYLAGLLAWLLAVSPANRAWSVDAWLRALARRAREQTVATAWLVALPLPDRRRLHLRGPRQGAERLAARTASRSASGSARARICRCSGASSRSTARRSR